MPNIMPITDLRKTNEISDLCHKSQEPVFITKNGYGDVYKRQRLDCCGAGMYNVPSLPKRRTT